MSVDFDNGLPGEIITTVKKLAPRIGVVMSTYHLKMNLAMWESAQEVLSSAGIEPKDITMTHAPGALEIPFLTKALIHYKNVDAVLGFGTILQGETRHHEDISRSIFPALTTLSVENDIPISTAILSVASEAQAWSRIQGPHGNKGKAAAEALLRCLAEVFKLQT